MQPGAKSARTSPMGSATMAKQMRNGHIDPIQPVKYEGEVRQVQRNMIWLEGSAPFLSRKQVWDRFRKSPESLGLKEIRCVARGGNIVIGYGFKGETEPFLVIWGRGDLF